MLNPSSILLLIDLVDFRNCFLVKVTYVYPQSPLRLPNFAISAYLYYISSEASQITIIKKVVKNPAQIVNGINIKLPKQEAGKHRNKKTKAPVRHIFDQ